MVALEVDFAELRQWISNKRPNYIENALAAISIVAEVNDEIRRGVTRIGIIPNFRVQYRQQICAPVYVADHVETQRFGNFRLRRCTAASRLPHIAPHSCRTTEFQTKRATEGTPLTRAVVRSAGRTTSFAELGSRPGRENRILEHKGYGRTSIRISTPLWSRQAFRRVEIPWPSHKSPQPSELRAPARYPSPPFKASK